MATKYIRRAAFLGDERGIVYQPVNDSSTIAVGDLVAVNVSDDNNIISFTALPDSGTKAQNQAAARAAFIGVAMKSKVASSGIVTIPVATRGVFEFDCASATYALGSLVGPQGTGAASAVGVSPTALETVTEFRLAIGQVYTKGVSVTRIKVEILSNVLPSFRIESGIATNTISEMTSGNGVAVAGVTLSAGAVAATAGILNSSATAGVGYSTGAGGTVTQLTSRTTGVTLNKTSGAITLVSAAGSATPASFTVTNSAVAATDTIILNQKSGTDKYILLVTNVAAGSFQITSYTTGGTTTEQPVFNFNVIKGVAA